ncbi:MAG: helix-turn-helix domain-containing protein [Microbacter sp.]
MLFADKIRQLREDNQMLKRQLASALEIDTPMYSKIERGDRPAKREQVVLIAKLLNTDEKELLTLWLADQIFSLVEDKKELATNALSIVLKNLKNETSHE